MQMMNGSVLFTDFYFIHIMFGKLHLSENPNVYKKTKQLITIVGTIILLQIKTALSSLYI